MKTTNYYILTHSESGYKVEFEVSAIDKHQAAFYAKMNIAFNNRKIKQFFIIEKSTYNRITK